MADMQTAAERHLGDLRQGRRMAGRQPVGGIRFADPRGDGVSDSGDRDARRRRPGIARRRGWNLDERR